MHKNLKILKKLFWDYNWESVLKNLDSPFVISRVLELGNPQQFKVLSSSIGDEKIHKFLKEKGRKLLSKKSFNFWNIYYAQKFNSIEGVKISFFIYPYKLLRKVKNLENIKIASLEDIMCMKISALLDRGSRKDFYDLYFILNHLKLSNKEIYLLFNKKFGNFNPLILNKALTFFEDVEKEPELELLKKLKWESVKKFFIKNFSKINLNFR